MMPYLPHARLPNVNKGCLLQMRVVDLAGCRHESDPPVAARLVPRKLLMPASDLRAYWRLARPAVGPRHRLDECVVTVQRTSRFLSAFENAIPRFGSLRADDRDMRDKTVPAGNMILVRFMNQSQLTEPL